VVFATTPKTQNPQSPIPIEIFIYFY